jgi:pyridoxal phosphate enzyme (YggS family)
MATIADNLQAVRARMEGAARAARRDPDAVTLLAVSKTRGVARIAEAIAAGQTSFGENYVQDAIAKMDAFAVAQPAVRLQWHLIGPVQSNKTRLAAERFDWVHTVDREKIARRLSDQRPVRLPPLNVLIQVNISGESSKAGVRPDEALSLGRAIVQLPRLRLRGLMAIPQPTGDVKLQRARFLAVHEIFSEMKRSGLQVDTLSMGMSGDMEAAILEGATLVRIGTAIFGERKSEQGEDDIPPPPPAIRTTA